MEKMPPPEAASEADRTWRHAPSIRTAQGDERRRALIQATYHLIAEKGVGGLRIHDVATRVGVNNATLHYYFPTKDSLLQAVSEQLGYEFITSPAPAAPGETAERTAREKMQDYFKSLAYQLHTAPERFVVINELFLAARRDEQIARVLEVDTQWQAYLSAILTEGVQQGHFRPDLDVAQTALTIIAFCKGLPLLATPDRQESTIAQFAEWFFTMASLA